MKYYAIWADYSGLRVRRVRTASMSLAEAVRWLGGMPRIDGPNGPLTDRDLYREDGTLVESWRTEIEAAGMVPLFVENPNTGAQRIVDAVDIAAAEEEWRPRST